jgi:hypothetical protein
MNPGDLVELCGNGVGFVDTVCVASEDGNAPVSNRYIPAGTLAVVLKKKKGAPDPAVVILVNGQLGWVWQNGIRPVQRLQAHDIMDT